VAERPPPHGGSRVDTADAGWVLDLAAALLLVEDDAGDALLVRETLADSGLSMDVTWRKTLAESRVGLPGTARPVARLRPARSAPAGHPGPGRRTAGA